MYRKSVSPVVAVIFLLGITISTIGVALGIIIPNVQRTTDIAIIAEFETNLQTLDKFLINLVNQPLNTSDEIRQTASRGVISYDSNSRFTIHTSIDGSANIIATIPFSRIIFETKLEGDAYPAGTHFYGRGSEDQSFFALNASTQRVAPRAIFNFSRPTTEPILYASFGYRILVETVYFDEYKVITTIKALKFVFQNKVQDSLTSNLIIAKYTDIQTTTFVPQSTAGQVARLNILTDVAEVGSYVETPLTLQKENYLWILKLIVAEIEIEI